MSFLNIFVDVMMAFLSLLYPVLIVILSIIVLFVLLVVYHLICLFFKGYRIKKAAKKVTYKKKKLLYMLFHDLPLRVAKDIYQSDPDKFPHHGMIIFTGRQGCGKTSAMAKQLIEWQEQFPLLKVATNFGYLKEDMPIEHWKHIVEYVNGKQGVVDAFDELQNWFGSNASKDFPPEMLGVITQNRKNTRVIMGTSQSFHLLAKSIRSQCTEIRECHTFLKCFCIVFKREPILDTKGDVVKMKNRGFYMFVHDDTLRDSYDTYKVIQNLSKSGFQAQTNTNVTVNVLSD